MLGDITTVDKIFIVCGYTDMRKSIDGLQTIIRDQMQVDLDGDCYLYLFCGRRCDRIKALFRESDGWLLMYKRLHKNSGSYKWPRNRNEVKAITWQQFNWLMSGLDIVQPKAIRSQ